MIAADLHVFGRSGAVAKRGRGKPDRRGNLYPAKQRPEQKIDAAVALMMAVGRAMAEDTNEGDLDGLPAQSPLRLTGRAIGTAARPAVPRTPNPALHARRLFPLELARDDRVSHSGWTPIGGAASCKQTSHALGAHAAARTTSKPAAPRQAGIFMESHVRSRSRLPPPKGAGGTVFA